MLEPAAEIGFAVRSNQNMYQRLHCHLWPIQRTSQHEQWCLGLGKNSKLVEIVEYPKLQKGWKRNTRMKRVSYDCYILHTPSNRVIVYVWMFACNFFRQLQCTGICFTSPGLVSWHGVYSRSSHSGDLTDDFITEFNFLLIYIYTCHYLCSL